MISKKVIKYYILQLEAITLMCNYKRERGLIRSDKYLLKGLQRYFEKIGTDKLINVGDVVINKNNIEYYRNKYKLI